MADVWYTTQALPFLKNTISDVAVLRSMLTNLTSSQCRNERQLLRNWWMIYRHSKTSGRNVCRSPGFASPLSCPLVKLGESVWTSVGAQNGNWRIFGVDGKVRCVSWAERQELAVWICVCCSRHVFTQCAEKVQFQEKDQFVHKRRSLQIHAGVVLEEIFKDFYENTFPH